jgi:malto-oligosyltrehalose trehalohydrolase
VPDPASRAQSNDVHDPSIVIDARAYRWRHPEWCGRPWHETVLYELHAGLLGGFAGVQAELSKLKQLGITAVELMPINDFPGLRNWGYDGVLPFAPDHAYGSPDDLKALVDTAHEQGLMIFLDVVYNHFGPDGNYLASYAPQVFRDDVKTPWGPAIDFRNAEVRRFFTENALYWLMEYRFDGLRFDAVHAITEVDWLDEMAAQVHATVEPGRHVHLVLEHDGNVADHLRRDFDAQWNDDAHHVLHVMLTGEHEGYYADYVERPAERLARVLAEGFVYQGEPSPHRKGERRGTPSTDLPPQAFVLFIQNHDQIGNRAFGERLTALVDPRALEAAIALQLLCPQIPLIFMGEEEASTTPFQFFTDHHGKLADAVREGRRREFASFAAFRDPQRRASIPDPNAAITFEQSRPAPDATLGSSRRDLYRCLLDKRRERIVPRLDGARALDAKVIGEAAVLARWRMSDGTILTIAINLGATTCPLTPSSGELLFATGQGAASAQNGQLEGHTTVAFLETSRG